MVLKSGSLNLLEPSEPVQACNGIILSLPLPLLFYMDLRTNRNFIPTSLLRYYNGNGELTALYELKDGRSGSGTDISPSTSVFPCPHLSINTSHSSLSTLDP
jgi:hypothetical protein